ncbi:hypothetical protein ABKN59_010620 [Abortiporus biennis]
MVTCLTLSIVRCCAIPMILTELAYRKLTIITSNSDLPISPHSPLQTSFNQHYAPLYWKVHKWKNAEPIHVFLSAGGRLITKAEMILRDGVIGLCFDILWLFPRWFTDRLRFCPYNTRIQPSRPLKTNGQVR